LGTNPLSKPLKEQSALKLEFANGTRIIGIPEGADQIRSYHPWGLLMDEAAFQPEAGEAYDAAVPVCQKIIVVSSLHWEFRWLVSIWGRPGMPNRFTTVHACLARTDLRRFLANSWLRPWPISEPTRRLLHQME
jgi:hypothetical protein